MSGWLQHGAIRSRVPDFGPKKEHLYTCVPMEPNVRLWLEGHHGGIGEILKRPPPRNIYTVVSRDKRPERYKWRPGDTLAECAICGVQFYGCEEVMWCADCAYDHPRNILLARTNPDYRLPRPINFDKTPQNLKKFRKSHADRIGVFTKVSPMQKPLPRHLPDEKLAELHRPTPGGSRASESP